MEMNKLKHNPEEFKKSIGLSGVEGETGYTTLERTSIRPTLDVNGIWGGYIGEGAKTVLPSKAFAKISMRLVPNQSSEKIAKLFEDYFIKIAPPSVHVSVKAHHGGSGNASRLRGIQSGRESNGNHFWQETNSTAWWRKYSDCSTF